MILPQIAPHEIAKAKVVQFRDVVGRCSDGPHLLYTLGILCSLLAKCGMRQWSSRSKLMQLEDKLRRSWTDLRLCAVAAFPTANLWTEEVLLVRHTSVSLIVGFL